MVSRSAMVAVSGSPELICSPGTLVLMADISPWISRGACGLGSKVSCCGGEPKRNTKMQDLALGLGG